MWITKCYNDIFVEITGFFLKIGFTKVSIAIINIITTLIDLQKAMGHSSINVSLTYLRELEIPELNEEDMPMIWI